MTQTRGIRLVVFFTFAIAASMFAAAPAPQNPTDDGLIVSSSAVQWQSTGQKVVLTVSGPNDFSFTKEFAAGVSPQLRMQDLGLKADGQYMWEMRVIPAVSSETRAKLAAAR